MTGAPNHEHRGRQLELPLAASAPPTVPTSAPIVDDHSRADPEGPRPRRPASGGTGWLLDDHTRRVGRRGVAAARALLDAGRDHLTAPSAREGGSRGRAA